MTADLDDNDTAGADRTPAAVPVSPVVRIGLVVAAVFLVVGALGLALAAVQMVWPDLVTGFGPLSYGRLLPAAWAAFLHGWLTVGLLAAAFHVVPRLAGRALRGGPLALLAVGLVAVGVGAGTVAIALGWNEGRPMLEMPLVADAVVVAGLLLAAVVVTVTASPTRLGPPTWYLVAASWWVVLVWIAGNVPGVAGLPGVIQSSFHRAALSGLWFVAAGVGVAYYVIPRLVGGDPARPTRLAVLGFWSSAIAWMGNGARDLIYGAAPDWFETLGVAFAIALVVPVLAITTDLALAVRGRWRDVVDPLAMRLSLAGLAMFLLVPFANLVQTLRSSSAVVQFTSWGAASDLLLFAGAIGFWLFAFVRLVTFRGDGAAPGAAVWHFRYSLVGLAVALPAMWMGGAIAGFVWAAGANEAIVTSAGDGFFNTVAGQEPYVVARAIGLAVFGLAQLLFLVPVLRRRVVEGGEVIAAAGDRNDDELAFAGQPPSIGWRRLRFGAVALFALGALVAWVLPALDPANADATILADAARAYPEGSAQAEGRQVYLREGCWYCHTQEVRGIVTDVGLGAVSLAGDYAHESPVLRGSERIGPDLMHAGVRDGTDSYAFVFAHLQEPRVARSWSNMPSYTYLSPQDLDVLTQYVVSLE